MIFRRLSNIGCILSYLIAFSLFLSGAQLQPPPTQPPQPQPAPVDCPHPTNYSDFNILLINNTIVITGGSLNKLEVWTQDISNGLDTTRSCWIDRSSSDSPSMANTTDFRPFKNGIGFRYSNSSFAVQAGDNGTPVMSSLALFDLTTNTWSNPAPALHGTQPSPKARMSVSLNTTTNIAWFYGGRTESSQQQPANYFNSFYNFDVNTNTWSWPTTYYSGGYRPARYGHSSVLVNERLFIIGGKTAVHSNDNNWALSSGDFQSVLVYDTVTRQSISMATIGEIPPARYSFSAVNAPDGRSIVMFGGQNASSESTFDASNEIFVLDTCTLNWTQPIIQGKPPVPRASHEAISFLNQYMIVMMGIQNYSPVNGPIYIDDVAILDMDTWTWVNSIPPSHHPRKSALPNCRFTFPVVIPDSDGGANNSTGETPSVISNNSHGPTITQLAVGITFGVLGFLILATAFVIFIIRYRRDVDAKQNPRWVPSLLKKKNKHQSVLTTSTSSSTTP